MNVKFYKRRENSDYFKHINYSLNNNDFNSQGKIQEKLITINTNNILIPRESRIKELEITLNPRKMNKIISPKNKPYLKPKFKLRNRNSFCIKSKNSLNKEKEEFKSNDGIKDINLKMFEIYYDEIWKKIKLIKEKKNDSKENNININNNKVLENNKENNSNNKTIKRIKHSYVNDFSNMKNNSKTNAKKNKKNIKDMKYFYPETPSQSTTTENKSDTKSRKTQTKNGTTNSKKQTNNKNKGTNEKNKIIKDNIYNDNLPIFLQKKEQYKKINKTYKEIYNENNTLNSKRKMQLLEKNTNNKKKLEFNKYILIKKINFNNL